MSEAISFPIAAERLIPHRRPMQMVDALLAFDGETGTVGVRVAEGNPLLEEDGSLAEVALMELLAQSYAAVQGYADSLAGAETRQGFLVGVRKAVFHARPQLGDELRVRVRATARFEGFAVVEGDVRRGGELLAEGNIKLWIVPAEGNER